MPDDYEQLKRSIEEGARAAEKLKKLLAEQKREERPRLRLVRGGVIGAALWAGVEWLFGARKLALALTAASVATGAVIAKQPGSPSAEPPVQESIVAPPQPRTQPPETRPPRTSASLKVSPLRTSPSRTTKSPAKRAAPAIKATRSPTPTPTASKPPIVTHPVSVTPTLLPSLTPKVAEAQDCTVDLLGLCILGK